jgi:cytochrome c-type biogenesis protein CcmE
MKVGALISGAVAALALGGVVIAFSNSASPYVTIQQAKGASGDRLHLAGKVDPASVHTDVYARTLTFRLTDDNGDTIQVVNRGDIPPNLAEAKNVVAVGGVKNGVFESTQLIVKCPSKYEAEKSGSRLTEKK